MTTRIGASVCGLILLVLAGAWASRSDVSPRDAWKLDDPVRIITDFSPQEKVDVYFACATRRASLCEFLAPEPVEAPE